MKNRKFQLEILKSLIKEEVEAALGGKPNPIISAPDYSSNAGIITISNTKGVAGIIIKTRHSSSINNIMTSPIFSMPKDTIKLQYSINPSTSYGKPVNINNFQKAFKQYKAEYDEVKNMIIYTIDFADDYRILIRNKPVTEILDISLPKEYQKAFMSNKFVIDVQQM